jgi:tetratricopeptide (TPR) repeat protein
METQRTKRTAIATLPGLALAILILPQAVLAGLIDRIEVDTQDTQAQLRIEFTVPMQYINHAPESRGDTIEIQLKNLAGNAFAAQSALDEQQTVSADSTSDVPLLDARYEQLAADRGLLTLRFSRSVDFSVRPGADRRHLVIDLPARPPVGNTDAAAIDQSRAPAVAADTVPERASEFAGRNHVINLESSIGTLEVPSAQTLGIPPDLVVYTIRFPIDGRVWNRLRVGFFASRAEATEVLNTLRDAYPRAWVAIAPDSEIRDAVTQTPASAPAPQAQLPLRPVPAIEPTRPQVPDDRIATLMEQARKAVAEQDYRRAVQLYTKILEYPDHPYRQDALEFLGVARERRGQFAHAIREYQRYLTLYPEGEGAQRVRQRLAGLTTAGDQPRPSADGRAPREKPTPWDIYGGISQFYRRDENSPDGLDSTVTQSSIATDLDVTARRRSDAYDIQSRFTGSWLYDFLDQGPGNETSVSSAYLDANGKQIGVAMRLGRQSRNVGGVLGRFDGLLLGYKVKDWLTLNAVGGFPVFSTRDSLDTDKYLYGISADLGTFADAWDFNTFIIEQKYKGTVDRRAIGGEARYFVPNRSLLTFVDYDIYYDSLNTFIFLGTWTLPDKTTLNASFDFRNSPILTTSNALQGQGVTSIDDLLDSFSESEIRQLAEDRTAESTTLTLGASHPFSQRLQLNGDVTVSELTGTDGSGGVEPIPGTGREYFYNLQVIGSSLITTNDIAILGLRYSNTSTADIYSASVNTRYPVNRDWRFNPRLRVDYRENQNDTSSQWITSPSLRMDYRWRRRYRFEVEGGGEWSTRDLADDTERSTSWFFSLGYRADF